MKGKLTAAASVALALVAGGAGTAWMTGAGPFAKGHHVSANKHSETHAIVALPDSRFVTLDQLVVMLRVPETTRSRYLAMDLVFHTDAKKEKQVKEHLPLLRSTAYRALADYSAEDIREMSVDELTDVLQTAFRGVYGTPSAVPFHDVQIGKQMLE
ncbi:flagellar basal body-associated FliL family protein [Dyella koreensis]|uniref:Flagellar protein FliL n=1 Tax=Dyella koreensis TaxID=311235 RepID=A0ABW8K5I5_9GAMM